MQEPFKVISVNLAFVFLDSVQVGNPVWHSLLQNLQVQRYPTLQFWIVGMLWSEISSDICCIQMQIQQKFERSSSRISVTV